MGRNLPLKTRRRNAAGLSARTERAWSNRKFLSLGSGRRATGLLGTGNAQFQIIAKTPGTAGNSLSVAIANGGSAPVVTVAGNVITVTTPVASTTAYDVVRAINFSVLSAPLVHAQRIKGSDLSAFVTADSVTLTTGSAPG